MNSALIGLILSACAYVVAKRSLQSIYTLDSKRRPNFFYKDVLIEEVGVPVFTYHSITSVEDSDAVSIDSFEDQMRYLAENNYQTITADELYGYLISGDRIPFKAVVITFDDGRASLWTNAFPVLKKYGFKATAFIVPSTIVEHGIRPDLNDYKTGGMGSLSQLREIDKGDMPAVTWDEVKIMRESGLIDFQSHSFDHSLIFYSPEIAAFVTPDFDCGYNGYNFPLIQVEGRDCFPFTPPLGTPIYHFQSRLSAARRFYDDEKIRNACIGYVERAGGTKFFKRRDWRAELEHCVFSNRSKMGVRESFETQEEQEQAIRKSLIDSKTLIEKHLPGHTVRHLCCPWHKCGSLAMSIAREVGYLTIFSDINSQKQAGAWNDSYLLERTLPVNEYGDDPYQITRIDAGYNMVRSLPGRNRLTYTHRVLRNIFKPPQRFRVFR